MYNKQPLHCKCFLIYLTWLLVGGGERFAAVSDEGLNTNPDVGQAHADGAEMHPDCPQQPAPAAFHSIVLELAAPTQGRLMSLGAVLQESH